MTHSTDMAIEVFHGIGYDCNIYLVNGEVLIDAGTGRNHGLLMKWLRERTDPEEIHTLILTHRHYDHTGGAARILEETGAEAYIHEADAPAVLNGDMVTTGARAFRGEQVPIKARQIKEGFTFNISGQRFEVLHTPGHTIGSISLWNEENGILFSGDTIFANGGVGRWDLPTGDFNALAESIKRLSLLPIRDLYPGHDVAVRESGREHAFLALESIGHTPFELMMHRKRYVEGRDSPM